MTKTRRYYYSDVDDIIHQNEARLRETTEEENAAICATFSFAPTFALELEGPAGKAAVLIQFASNSEGDNDMPAELLALLLERFLEKAETE